MVSVDFGKVQYTPKQQFGLYQQVRDRFSALPGVISAAQVGFTPVGGSGWDNDIGPDSARAAASGKQAFFNRAAPGYFAKPFALERISYATADPNASARESLRSMIAETQELLSQQIKAIHEAFDNAVRTYREIDELLPEKKKPEEKNG